MFNNIAKREKKPKLTKKALAKHILFFVLSQIVFVPIFGIILTYYGPFQNVKEMVVTSAMTTLTHQYLATWFLPQAEIDKIMAKNTINPSGGTEDLSNVNVSYNSNDINIIDISEGTIKGKLMVVTDPRRVTVGTSPSIGEAGATLSQIVKSSGAVGGVNAGGFGDQKMAGTGGKPTGIIVQNKKIVYTGISEDGHFDVVGFNTEDKLIIKEWISVDEIKSLNLRDAISFNPALVINGKGTIKGGNGGWGIAPRTAIAQRKDGSVLLLVLDGRQATNPGASLKAMQDILLKNGAYNASNLDGGSSTTMVFKDDVVNNPSDIMGERAIPTAFVVTK